MTDRHAGYVVILKKDLREDDAQATVAALKRIKGVLDVQPVTASVDMMIAETRAAQEFRAKLVKTFFENGGT